MTQERDPLMRYAHARADLADKQAEREATDPEEARLRAAEHRMLRLLIAMVGIIVVGGFIISIVGLIITGGK
jgi:hypothetical protein